MPASIQHYKVRLRRSRRLPYRIARRLPRLLLLARSAPASPLRLFSEALTHTPRGPLGTAGRRPAEHSSAGVLGKEPERPPALSFGGEAAAARKCGSGSVRSRCDSTSTSCALPSPNAPLADAHAVLATALDELAVILNTDERARIAGEHDNGRRRGCVPAVPDLNRREGLRPEAGRGQAFWAQP